MTAAVVDTGALVKVVWVSVVASVGVMTAFSLAVLGGVRGSDRRRTRGTAAALPYYAIAALGLLACAWATYRGYLFIVEKS